MALSAGARLGLHEIISPLGVGGMGEVWRARDTKLGREVALKILPDLFAADPDRLARFRREAHVLASLNHPHIGAIYGLAEADGLEALVLELVEGPTLADRIARGPIPLDEALPIARQIADALDAAHGQGIVHRDLKPSNIKLRPDGTVKVLDFGLAKALEPVGSVTTDPTTSPTLTARGTELGVIVGTAAYMAPEQAKGKPIDKRADVWAFGVVLYEMLTGRPPFEGETVTDVVATVLTRPPDWNALAATTPAPLRRLLHRCLEKDPKRRLRDIADAAIEIDEALSGSSADEHAGADAAALARGGGRRRAVALGAGAVLLAGLASAATWLLAPAPVPSAQIVRFTVALPSGQLFSSLSAPVVAISPDGRRLAYETRFLYVRDLEQLAIRTVTTPSPVSSVFFSPDGEWLGYSSTGQILKVPVSGGTSQVVTDAEPTGATWTDADTIVFAQLEKGLFRVATAGGTPELLFPVERPAHAAWPQVLPGGRHVLYTEAQPGSLAQADAVIRALDGSDRRIVLGGAAAARYVETGHLLYSAGERVMAVPFDLAARRVTGEAVALAEPINVSLTNGLWQAAWSRTGTLIHLPPIREHLQLVWVDRHGTVTPAALTPRPYSDPRLSPDARRLAAHLQDDENDVWAGDLSRGALTRLTFDRMEDETPVWSPDGRNVAYAASRAGPSRGVYTRAADGSGPEEFLWNSAEHSHVIDWSPDGRALVVNVLHPTNGSDLLLLDLETRHARPLIQSRFNDRYGRLSPDGRWIAYSSDESGREEIYVQPFPGLDARVQVSPGGGTQPIWSRDGRELYYRGPRDVMASAVDARAPMVFAPPHALFADRFERPQPDGHITYDVAPDGRFLMIAAPRADGGTSGRNEIHVVLNWFEELKARAPTNHEGARR